VLIFTAATIDRRSEEGETPIVDLDVQLVDRLVAAHHFVDQRRVPRDQPVDGRPHAFLGQPAHLEQPRLEPLELLLEVSYGPFHHSPQPRRARRPGHEILFW
jgi:hypothetical protein